VAGGGDGPGGGDRADAVPAATRAARAAALTGEPVTIDLDTTDLEVYGRRKRGVAYHHQGQRAGRPHVASWAETEIPLAADLGDGTGDPRGRAGSAAPRAGRPTGPGPGRAGGAARRRRYFAGQLARAAHDARIAFAIGARRIAPLWRLLAGLAEEDRTEAIEMDGAQVAAPHPAPGPEGPAHPRARRRRRDRRLLLHPDKPGRLRARQGRR
jgi:hypothetical protein